MGWLTLVGAEDVQPECWVRLHVVRTHQVGVVSRIHPTVATRHTAIITMVHHSPDPLTENQERVKASRSPNPPLYSCRQL